MDENETSAKLCEIRRMAERFHGELESTSEPGLLRLGGNLFLGRYYAESDRIYFGLNPGLTDADCADFEVGLLERNDFNIPFNNPKDYDRQFPYGRNWTRFLSQHPDLRNWFNDRVTSSFLSPWRTERGGLKRLNRVTDGRVYRFSGMLVQRMVEHHDARLLIVAAREGLDLLASPSFLGFSPWKLCLTDEQNLGRLYHSRALRVNLTLNTRLFSDNHSGTPLLIRK